MTSEGLVMESFQMYFKLLSCRNYTKENLVILRACYADSTTHSPMLLPFIPKPGALDK